MLTRVEEVQLSKFMTKILRHTPDKFGVILDERDGSCEIGGLLQVIQTQSNWGHIAYTDLESVVKNCEKQRFEIVEGRIRARYGHSHAEVQYEEGIPPKALYHGTNQKAVASIFQQGIRPMKRQYVHLSEGLDFAVLAGSRRGELVIIVIDTEKALLEGTKFFLAGNEVWLADRIPASCCRLR